MLELKSIFENNGFVGIAAGAFIGEHSIAGKVATERPDKDDLSIAQDFGDKISKILEKGNESSELTVKGNFPFIGLNAMPYMAPETDDSCTNCGICAENCPMDAISFSNFKEVDATKCILCCSCVKKCPENSKQFKQEGILNIISMLETNFSEIRKEPELFF